MVFAARVIATASPLWTRIASTEAPAGRRPLVAQSLITADTSKLTRIGDDASEPSEPFRDHHQVAAISA